MPYFTGSNIPFSWFSISFVIVIWMMFVYYPILDLTVVSPILIILTQSVTSSIIKKKTKQRWASFLWSTHRSPWHWHSMDRYDKCICSMILQGFFLSIFAESWISFERKKYMKMSKFRIFYWLSHFNELTKSRSISRQLLSVFLPIFPHPRSINFTKFAKLKISTQEVNLVLSRTLVNVVCILIQSIKRFWSFFRIRSNPWIVLSLLT